MMNKINRPKKEAKTIFAFITSLLVWLKKPYHGRKTLKSQEHPNSSSDGDCHNDAYNGRNGHLSLMMVFATAAHFVTLQELYFFAIQIAHELRRSPWFQCLQRKSANVPGI